MRLEELDEYLRRKVKEVRDVERMVRSSAEFNHRELALLSDAVRHPDRSYSFKSHATRHGVTHETARADLSRLSERGLLTRHQIGRRHVFRPVEELPELLKQLH
jgi:Fic family protein